MIADLFKPWVGSKEVCGKMMRRRKLVRLQQAVHVAAFLPTGEGKGASLIVPFLKTCNESCFVLDLKSGENAKLTARLREKMGHDVALIDPYRVFTDKPDTFNPLDFISANSRLALDDCNELSNAWVVRSGNENEPHWNDRAEGGISAVTAVTVAYGENDKGTRCPSTIREIIAAPARLDMAMKLMADSGDLWDGQLVQMGGDLFHLQDKEKSSVISTMLRHLRFLGTPAIAENTRTSSFMPDFRRRKLTVYLILPSERIDASAGYIRMIVSSMIAACIRDGLDEARRAHFVLDETGALGPMPAINHALGMGRGSGIRLQTYWQSQGQLKKCFPKEGEDLALLSNSSQIYAAVNEPVTSDFVARRLGTKTIVVQSGGSNWGRSWGASHGRDSSTNHGGSGGGSSGWNQQARNLLNPDEVAALPRRVAITFTPGMPPIRTWLLRYYEEKRLGPGGWFSRFRAALGTLILSAVLCAASLWLATALTRIANAPKRPHYQPIHQNNKRGPVIF